MESNPHVMTLRITSSKGGRIISQEKICRYRRINTNKQLKWVERVGCIRIVEGSFETRILKKARLREFGLPFSCLHGFGFRCCLLGLLSWRTIKFSANSSIFFWQRVVLKRIDQMRLFLTARRETCQIMGDFQHFDGEALREIVINYWEQPTVEV